MLQPDATDAQLEYSYMKDGFGHIQPDLFDPSDDKFSILTSGLVEALNNLAFLNKLYPLVNSRLADNQLIRALEEIEAPAQSLLAAMECRGIGLDSKRLKNYQNSIESRVNQLEEHSRRITKNTSFLLSSPKQVSEYLFDVLNINMPTGLVSKNAAGSNHRSTSEETLRAIRAEMLQRDGEVHPIIDVILEFRCYSKVLTTFLVPLPQFCYKDGDDDTVPKIHPQWMQTVREVQYIVLVLDLS